MSKKKSKKKTPQKKASATDLVVKFVLENPKATVEEISESLKQAGFKAKPAPVAAQAHHTRKIARIIAGMDDIQKVLAGFRE